MAILNSSYTVTNETGFDTYHFETGVGVVSILDKNKKVVGNLQDLVFVGTNLDGVDYKTLKVKGLYGITNIKGVDTKLGVAVDKMNILSVDAFGDIGSPKFIIYKLITPDGKVFDNVVVGGKEIGWTSGGKELEKTLTEISKSTGDTSKLTTTNKTSLTNAVNEVDKNTKKVIADLKVHNDEFVEYKKHNHDDSYVKKSGGEVTGEMVIDNNVAIAAKDARNEKTNIVHVGVTDILTIGSKNLDLEIIGKGLLKHNGKKVWTEDTQGKGSGLDADKIGGVSHTLVAYKNAHNVFEKDVKVNGKLMVGSSLEFGGNSAITSNANGRILVSTGGKNSIAFETNGRMSAMNHILMNAKNNEVGFRFALSDKELGDGMGFYRNPSSKYLGIYNWTKSKRIGYFSDADERLYLDQSISIQGRKLYLQGAQPPVGKAGDIWIK